MHYKIDDLGNLKVVGGIKMGRFVFKHFGKWTTIIAIFIIFCFGGVRVMRFFNFKSFFIKPKVLLAAHRGLSSMYPENTMISFRNAIDSSDFVELDVQLTKDGVPVVIHDETLERTTNQKGNVSDFTLEEIKKLDAGSWFDEKYKDEKIPTLQAVLEFAKNKIKLLIEIKEVDTQSQREQIAQKCLDLVKRYGMQNDVAFLSFDHKVLQVIKKLDPQAKIYLIFGWSDFSHDLIKENKIVDYAKEHLASGVIFNSRLVTKKLVKELKNNCLVVGAYTINNIGEFGKFRKMHVDLICSDETNKLKDSL